MIAINFQHKFKQNKSFVSKDGVARRVLVIIIGIEQCEFKSETRLYGFHILLIPNGKVYHNPAHAEI